MATAAENLAAIESAIAEHPAGVVTVVVDGTSVRFDRKQLLAERDYWQRRVNQASGKRPVSGSINLSNAW